MRVAILCTCAEPGRDGVGDYSVRLASALAADGHDVLVMAERDVAITAQTPLAITRESVRVARLPGSAPDEQRGRWLAAELDAFAPDWVVLQFVCWGFADRGILNPPPAALIAALSGRRVAIYCHELWLGLERGASLRHRWWGWRQRESILRFLAMLKPALVLTSNPVYRAILQRFGWPARIVPLHSNIPVHPGGAGEMLRLLERRAGRPLWEKRSDVLMLAVFGTLFPGWNPQAALRWLRAEAQRRGRRLLLVAAGRISKHGEALLAQLSHGADAALSRGSNGALARGADAALTCVTLGEAEPAVVSGLLQEADIGLPSNGWLLLGKSGVAAAMHAHGLPMLVVRQERTFRDLPGFDVDHSPSVFRFDPALPPAFDSLVGARRPAADTLPQAGRELMAILQHAR